MAIEKIAANIHLNKQGDQNTAGLTCQNYLYKYCTGGKAGMARDTGPYFLFRDFFASALPRLVMAVKVIISVINPTGISTLKGK